jgi:hypothetical protein
MHGLPPIGAGNGMLARSSGDISRRLLVVCFYSPFAAPLGASYQPAHHASLGLFGFWFPACVAMLQDDPWG